MSYTSSTVFDLLVRDSPKVVGAFFVFLAIRLVYRSLTSPTRNIPGPPHPGLRNWLVGHRALLNEEEVRLHRFGVVGTPTDPRAAQRHRRPRQVDFAIRACSAPSRSRLGMSFSLLSSA